jgi:hypothetical protein
LVVYKGQAGLSKTFSSPKKQTTRLAFKKYFSLPNQMIFSKLCVLVVATLTTFATASPTNLGARANCPVGNRNVLFVFSQIFLTLPALTHNFFFQHGVGRKEFGNYKNRALAINKLGATVAGGITPSTPVWVKCSDQLAEVESHHTFTW